MAQEEQLSVSKKVSPNAVLQFTYSRLFKYMDGEHLEKDKEDLLLAIKQRNITSYADLFAKANKKFPSDASKGSGTFMTPEQVDKMHSEQAEKEAQARLSKFLIKGTKEERPYKWFKLHLDLQTKGMDFATYQIRVGGVSKKNHSKFDDLYKEVTAFILILEKQYRPLAKGESEDLEEEIIKAQHSLRKIQNLMIPKNNSYIQAKYFGFKSMGMTQFRWGVFDELDTTDKYLENLKTINHYEQEFEKVQPDDTKVLQYFYFLSWKMYNLLDDDLFSKKKNYKQDFYKFTHTLLGRFIWSKQPTSWEKTKDSIRKNLSFKKMKLLNIHKMKNEKQYHQVIKKLFT